MIELAGIYFTFYSVSSVSSVIATAIKTVANHPFFSTSDSIRKSRIYSS